MSSPSVIARAMDAWRIRLWLTKGPRCPCKCGERVPWSFVKTEAFDRRHHISTPRRPVRGCRQEVEYIPSTLTEFSSYLVQRRNLLHKQLYSEMLWRHCVAKNEAWAIALLSNGHVCQYWRMETYWQAPLVMTFQLVHYKWFEAANMVLSWPETASRFNEEDMMYLVKKPYRNGYEHMDCPLSAAQRNWLMNHPALAETTRKARAHKHWMSVLLWTDLVKSYIRLWKGSRIPLPSPSMENLEVFEKRLRKRSFILNPVNQTWKDMLTWVAFLAKESPTSLRRNIPDMNPNPKWIGEWQADMIEVLATQGRVKLLHERLNVFERVNVQLQKEKIWKWVNMPAFAVPRVSRHLIRIGVSVLHSISDSGMARKLLNSTVVVATIDRICNWLANKLPDRNLLHLTRPNKSTPVAVALRTTPRHRALQHVAKLRATVYLTLFFRNHVSLAAARAVTRGDCPICWAPKILQPLHGDIRHGMCHRCMRRMQRKNMLDKCPMCRISLTTC